MAKRQAVMLVLVAATLLVVGELPAAAVDDVWLRNGGRLRGDLDDADLSLLTPQGPYRVTRERAWRLVLDVGTGGDSVDLRNGNRLTGRLDRGRYGLRLAGGETRTLNRGEILTVTLGAPRAAGGSRLSDVVILQNGDHVSGEVSPSEFEIAIPSGTHRFGRDAVWQITLDSVSGDTIRLGNGTSLSGTVEQPWYDVRTPDGQVVSFARGQVKAVVPAPPARPRAAAPGPTAAVTPSPAPAPPPVAAPSPALPPAIRAVLRDLHFEFDRWELTPDARRILDELATAMKAYPRLGLVVEGHADERGTSEYNLALGARRAQSARDYLVSLGIEPERVETMSYGEERPLDPGHTEMAWALNRRAHFVVKGP